MSNYNGRRFDSDRRWIDGHGNFSITYGRQSIYPYLFEKFKIFQIRTSNFIIMPRRTHRSVKARANYSRENRGVYFQVGQQQVNGVYQGGSLVVPPSTVQGTRTVKNFSITIPVTGNVNSEYWWALVYVPQSQTAQPLFAATQSPDGSLYEPNQYVIASGMSDNNAGPIRIRSKMARKLHSGDFISLVLGLSADSQGTNYVKGLVSYSIKYN